MNIDTLGQVSVALQSALAKEPRDWVIRCKQDELTDEDNVWLKSVFEPMEVISNMWMDFTLFRSGKDKK